jgi:polyhydroxyalkanoate synthesis regulator phasin
VSGAGSAAVRDRMDEPASRDGDRRGLVEELLLAGLGAVALTAERADRLADELAERGGLERDEARRSVEHLLGRWRGDSVRLTERASEGLASLFRDLGLVTREEYEDLELRVAQLEHRLRLVEGEPPPTRTRRL